MVSDHVSAAVSNQNMLRHDPLEMMLRQMRYNRPLRRQNAVSSPLSPSSNPQPKLSEDTSDEEEEGAPHPDSPLPCLDTALIGDIEVRTFRESSI